MAKKSTVYSTHFENISQIWYRLGCAKIYPKITGPEIYQKMRTISEKYSKCYQLELSIEKYPFLYILYRNRWELFGQKIVRWSPRNEDEKL
jgi:hypothetical protein